MLTDTEDSVRTIISDLLLPFRTGTTGVPLGLVFLSCKNQYPDLASCFRASGPVHLELERYSCDEMTQILLERAAAAFHQGTVPEKTPEICAKHADRKDASPKKALELLLKAGQVAARDRDPKVLEWHVQIGVSEMGWR